MKKITKAQRIENEKAALKQRLMDLARGSYGGYAMTEPGHEDFMGYCSELGIEAYARYVGAIKALFSESPETNVEISPGKMYGHWFDADDVYRYDKPDEAAEFMYAQGARA